VLKEATQTTLSAWTSIQKKTRLLPAKHDEPFKWPYVLKVFKKYGISDKSAFDALMADDENKKDDTSSSSSSRSKGYIDDSLLPPEEN